MQPDMDTGAPSWALRVMRPWVVACVAGAGIGALLLVLEPSAPGAAEGFASFYSESDARFATQSDAALVPVDFGTPVGSYAGAAEADGSFSAAEPVSVDDLR